MRFGARILISVLLLTMSMPVAIVHADSPASQVRVETQADGLGTVVTAQSLISGNHFTVYAISRDSSGNFVANVAADTWSLPTETGGVVNADLVPSGDGMSAIFTGNLVGTATIEAAVSGLTLVDSGTITVTVGPAAKIAVHGGNNQSAAVGTAVA